MPSTSSLSAAHVAGRRAPRPAGLCGELIMIIRVRGVTARAHGVPVDRVVRELQRHEDRRRRRSTRSPARTSRSTARGRSTSSPGRTDAATASKIASVRAGRHRDFGLRIVAPAAAATRTSPRSPRAAAARPASARTGSGRARMCAATASMSAGSQSKSGKALRQVDRAELGRQPRHDGEDGRADRRQLRLERGSCGRLEDAALAVLAHAGPTAKY